MQKLGLILVCLVSAIAGPVLAADLPAPQAPPPPPIAPAFAWTGAYVGAAAGYGWGGAGQSMAITSASLAAAPPIIPVIDASGSQRFNLQSAQVEADAGYDWRIGQSFVFGVKGDIAWTGFSGSQFNGGNIPNYPPGNPYNIAQTIRQDWQGSLQLRVGFIPFDRLLVYGTGGPALAHVNYTSAFTDVFNEDESASLHTFRPGWTIGVGAEYAFAPNWTARLEYRYSQFLAANVTGAALLDDGTIAYAAHSTGVILDNSVRAGVSFHFN